MTHKVQGARLGFAATLACAALLCLAAAATAAVRVSGAPSFNQTVFQLYKSEIEQQAGTSISVVSVTSERGVDDLFAGRADIAMLGARLATVAKTIGDKRATPIDMSRLSEFVLGESHVDFVVNPSNPVKSLKREDLAGILGGKIGSWSSVGGTAHPILVAVEPTDPMYQQIQVALLTPLALTWTPRSRVVESVLQIPPLIAQAPDAIGYMNSLASPDQKRRVQILATDVVLSRLQVLVTLTNATPEVRKVVEATKATLARVASDAASK